MSTLLFLKFFFSFFSFFEVTRFARHEMTLLLVITLPVANDHISSGIGRVSRRRVGANDKITSDTYESTSSVWAIIFACMRLYYKFFASMTTHFDIIFLLNFAQTCSFTDCELDIIIQANMNVYNHGNREKHLI